jgi:hypothetical protein
MLLIILMRLPCYNTFFIAKNYITKQFDGNFELNKTVRIDLLNRSLDFFKTYDAIDKRELGNHKNILKVLPYLYPSIAPVRILCDSLLVIGRTVRRLTFQPSAVRKSSHLFTVT